MKRYKKQDYLAIAGLLRQVNTALAKTGWNDPDIAAILIDCQDAAIKLGTCLEQQGEEGIRLTHILEDYCENLYQMGEALKTDSGAGACAELSEAIEEQLKQLEAGIQEKLRDKKEIVFLPYKAAMWDSLESVWMAADRDPDCDAYVVPIPYYERNSDHSFGKYHYEGGEYPKYVPIVNYEEFDLEEHHPDVIYIHNPYDEYNYVTSVDPRFYSKELKKYTDCLVYIPYYTTTGGMAEGQSLCSAYLHADYIVIQSENYRKFFDERIPDSKFLALGSPKFDSVIRKCQNPPEPPVEWKDKMTGRKVYFYNTSITGMLEDTDNFLKKMRYVFDVFKGREDACLLWRPHPLLESTFDSMRKEYKSTYDSLKKEFVQENIGILDETSDIEITIALSDVYIGDSGTSVTSLFGVAGKPLFILDNSIHTLPEKDDWHGSIAQTLRGDFNNRYCITQGDSLYVSKQNDGYYEYFCDLTEYTGGGYYMRAIEYGEKIYAVPANAQNILRITKDKKITPIPLKERVVQPGAFAAFCIDEEYMFIVPNQYPDLIRFNMETEAIDYIPDFVSFYGKNADGTKSIGVSWRSGNNFYFLNAEGTKVLILDKHSLKSKIKEVSINREIAMGVLKDLDAKEVWLIPKEGTIVTRWNLLTGEMRDFDLNLPGLTAIHRQYNTETDLNVIGAPALVDDQLIFSPHWGNKFIQLNVKDGSVSEWIPPFAVERAKNPYFKEWCMGYFIKTLKEDIYFYFYEPERKTYEINMRTLEYRDMNIRFSEEDVFSHIPGFSQKSQWLSYCCREDVFNSLQNLLDDTLNGRRHNKEVQLEAFRLINANTEGTCGEEIHKRLVAE